MKKILSFFICMSFLTIPAYSTVIDDFANKSLDNSLKINNHVYKPVYDDFAEKSLDRNLKISSKKTSIIRDTFAENNTNKNIVIKKQETIQDFIPKINTQKVAVHKKVITDTSSAIEVPVKICKLYSTRYKIDEGDFIDFETTKDITIKEKTYPKGTIVKGRVENVSMNQAMGVPSDLVIGNFSIKNLPLYGEINKTGANRSLWVYPCVYGLSWFFGVGILFIPIRGGHAKIHPNAIYTLYAQ